MGTREASSRPRLLAALLIACAAVLALWPSAQSPVADGRPEFRVVMPPNPNFGFLKQAKGLPAIVFVQRGGAGVPQLPGVGPLGRTMVAGGQLRVREKDGRVRTLVSGKGIHDVSDPAVSWDGSTIAFAGYSERDTAWRT